MKENVKFEISGFKEAIDAMSKTQEVFKNLGKAIEQFNNAQPSKGVKLKRLLARHFIKYGWCYVFGITSSIAGIKWYMWEFYLIMLPNVIMVNIYKKYDK